MRRNGVYPEGAMYWGYGTSFETVLIERAAIQSGHRLGFEPESRDFLQSADFLFQIKGPTGAYFNYSDGTERPSLEGGNYWFAHQLKRPELLNLDAEHLKKYSRSANVPTKPHTAPMIVCYRWRLCGGQKPFQKRPQVLAAYRCFWHGDGPVPLAAFRTSWDDPNAMFLALKGGHATSKSRAHGRRFVCLSKPMACAGRATWECRIISRWNRRVSTCGNSKQDGGRWQVFRLGPFSHNTLTVNDQLHRAEGDARITHFSDNPQKRRSHRRFDASFRRTSGASATRFRVSTQPSSTDDS